MNARTYTVSGDDQTIIGGATLVFINPDTDVGIDILRCWVGQDSSEAAEQQRINMVTQVTAFPTLVTATPQPHLLGEVSKIVGGTAGAAGTCGINASAEGAGAKTIVIPDAVSNLNGFLWVATPEERITLAAAAASGFGLRMATTPTVLTGWSFGVTFRER